MTGRLKLVKEWKKKKLSLKIEAIRSIPQYSGKKEKQKVIMNVEIREKVYLIIQRIYGVEVRILIYDTILI
jgi:hypothetical protein